MKNLSFKEWVAVAAAVVFVTYMLFGDSVISAFKKSSPSLTEQNQTQTQNMANVNGASNTNNVAVTDLVVGMGKAIAPGMIVSVNYVLKLQDGTLIQDSKVVANGEPFQFVFGAGQLIPGWEMGIAGMKVGGKRVITIPPELGYGAEQVGPIPPNSTLVFEIEVVAVEAAPAINQ